MARLLVAVGGIIGAPSSREFISNVTSWRGSFHLQTCSNA